MRTQKNYKIKSGNNYCNRFNLPLPHRPLWKPTEMIAKLTLNESMVYRNDNDGWMKLCGFSRGHHHDNSFRFVWRCWKGNFEIAVYCYLNNRREIEKLASWPIDKIPFGCNVFMGVLFKFNEVELIEISFNSVCHTNTLTYAYLPENLQPIGYLLTPHFENPKSDQSGAPHNINIPLQIEIR